MADSDVIRCQTCENRRNGLAEFLPTYLLRNLCRPTQRPGRDDGDLHERREVMMVRTKWLTLITEGDISDFRVHWQAVAAIDSEEPLCPYKS